MEIITGKKAKEVFEEFMNYCKTCAHCNNVITEPVMVEKEVTVHAGLAVCEKDELICEFFCSEVCAKNSF